MRPMPAAPWPRRLLHLLGRRLPKASGRVRVIGLSASATIRRDRWGIPHVDAANGADAWFALGFCHAQDRAFQLELIVRAGRGTLSELLGTDALAIDRLSRRMGFARVAASQEPRLDADVRATVRAYVTGVNAGIEAGPRPHELVLLRARPTRWTATDVLAFQGLQSLALGANWDAELARFRILIEDGAEALAAVDPTYGPWLPVASPVGGSAGAPLGRLAADLAALRDVVGGGGGSNAWAIAGSRTASGVPLLANDPHLAPDVPPPWYLPHLRSPEWQLAGASFVGGPAMPSGHNGFAAWGVTAACSDGSDLFLEELSPDRQAVRHGDGWQACDVVREEIAVRGTAEPLVEEVLVTPRGPIVSPILDGVGHALSLGAVWLDPRPVRGFLDTARAQSFEELRRAFAAWTGPGLNVCYADGDGHVAWQLVGQLPVRRRGNGTLPAPGWDPTYGWADELLPFDAMPFELDPPSGFVVSANNQPRTDAADLPYLGIDWLDGYRAARIAEVIGSRDDWDVAACQSLQRDELSIPWRELREAVLAVPADAPATSRGLDLLRAWDGRVSADAPAAAIFELFVAELASSVAAAAAPRAWRWSLGAGFGPSLPGSMLSARSVSNLVRLIRDEAPDRLPRSWPDEMAATVGSVVERLEREHGTDPAGWAWGRLRPLRIRHPLDDSPIIRRLFGIPPIHMGGDMNTVSQAGARPLRPLANPSAIANHRTVIDLADPERSRYVLAGGQSGNPLSPHYADLFALWRDGVGVPIPWSEESVAHATVATLRLEPQG